MTPFLKLIARKFIQTKELRDELYRYRFFFQNKRAGKFFHHYLKELAPAGTHLILPEVTTLPTYLRERQHVVEEDVNNDLFLIFHLHNVYIELIKSKASVDGDMHSDKFQDLNTFYQLGKQILTDFGDLDLQLADHREVFRNLQELKDLDADAKDYLTDRQISALEQFIKKKADEKPLEKRFSTFYNDLSRLYEMFKERLREEHLAYNGMLLRDTCNNIEAGLDLCTDGKYNIFVGLNALTKAEKKILSHFKESGRSFFYWDYDSELFDNEALAGSFKRENHNLFPEPKADNLLYIEREKNKSVDDIEVIATPSKTAQTAYIGAELNKLAKTEEGRQKLREMKVAVVLANERLLTPLLSNLDATLFVEKPKAGDTKRAVNLANVTMGYPIKELPIVGLMVRLLQLQKIRHNRKDNYWRGDEVNEVLSSNFFDIQSPLQNIINQKKYIFINDDKLDELITSNHEANDSALLKLLFFMPREEDDRALIDYLLEIVNTLYHRELNEITDVDSDNEDTDEGQAESMSLTALRLLKELLEKQKRSLTLYEKRKEKSEIVTGSPFTFETLYDILTNLLNRARVPFSGEPLRGLQIMGILETRGLDFETVYIVDATDGIMPANTKVMGVLPHLLRAGHQLPTYQWQEQTRSYNFFRLISRAKKVVALYDSRKDGSSRGEPSRYIQQLKYVYGIKGLKMTTANFDILAKSGDEQPQYDIDMDAIDTFRVAITKEGIGSRHISPTRILDYIECPRKFYFKSIIGIQETEELDDLLDESVLGSLVHNTINSLYRPFSAQILAPDILKKMLNTTAPHNQIENALKNAFKELNNGSEIPEIGINKINYDTAYALVKNIILMDTQQNSLEYIEGEAKIKTSMLINDPDNPKSAPTQINITGFIDRIDRIDGVYRIIDYKTGGDIYEVDLEKSMELDGKSKINKAAIQLLNYCLVVYRKGLTKEDNSTLIQAGSNLIPLMIKPRSMENDLFTLKYKRDSTPLSSFNKVIDSFSENMDRILLRIAKSDNEFRANPGRNGVCNYCPAREICPDVNINTGF